MNSKIRFIIPFLSLILIFSFAMACGGGSEASSTTEKTEAVATEGSYTTQMIVITSKISESLGTFGQSMEDASNGKISISKNKIDTNNFIKDINDCYDIYLSLKVPEKFNTPHELTGKAMEHFINATVYLQQYIDSDDIGDMSGFISKATSEILIASGYIKKATEQYNNLK